MGGADRGKLRTEARKVPGSHRYLHRERLDGMVFTGGGGLQRIPSAITVALFQQTRELQDRSGNGPYRLLHMKRSLLPCGYGGRERRSG
ncbi:hypothetical protein DPMN_007376 [Dreissena polymorpha]|uniref:Uncharacterized protein n=1 Tax=Dreissena polymorpha TaxID=45954 RepID=A0A9D4MWX1_DREPO|nr:hypothetical protein DPMN_007376 [Dreissena polymorpha]